MSSIGCSSLCGGQSLNYKASNAQPLKSMSGYPLHVRAKLSFPSVGSSLRPYQELRSYSPHGWFTQPKLPRRHPSIVSPRAVNFPPLFTYPPMEKKPRWWWRALACLPYLMPLHESWMYAQTTYKIHPFFEDFEFLTYPFLRALGKLPRWFLMAYFFCGYLGVVRRKEWPHFFRFNVLTSMLLEISLQIAATVSQKLPRGFTWGKLGAHVWLAFSFAFFFTVVCCMVCALRGWYADVPFVSNAAYIQLSFD